MAMTNVKKGLLVLFIVWLVTLSYIWLPGIIPDFLHIRGKLFSLSKQETKLKDGINGRIFSNNNNNNNNNNNTSHPAVATAKPQPAEEEHQHQQQQQQQQQAVHVVIGSEQSRLGGLVTVVKSIVTNARHPHLVFFHLVTDKESSAHLKLWLMSTELRSINYEIIEFPQEWVASKIGFRGTRTELGKPMNYARYYLPRLLPHVDGRIIYLDDDCIVQGDIAELQQTKLKAGTLAAFAEGCQGMSKRVTFMKNVYGDFFDLKNQHFKELNIKPSACAFNAGVFVTRLADWRRHNVTAKLEHWLQLNAKEELYGNERGGGGAQPPMMLVFYNNYTPLDPMWNVHYLGWAPRSSYSRQFVQRAKLLHWSGRFKPWGRTSPFQDLWDRYYLPDPRKEFVPLRKGAGV